MTAKSKDLQRKKPSAQAMKNAEIAHLLALVFGHNELAKKAESLGEKVYHRLASENYVKALHKLGRAFVVHQPEGKFLEIKQGRACVTLYPRDIELMRKAIAEYDAKEKAG